MSTVTTQPPQVQKQSLRRRLATSQDPLPRMIRAAYKSFHSLSVPAPKVIVRPILWLFITARSIWHYLFRIFVCEPFFKAYCKSYGRNLRTDCFIHWIQGKGDIICGDNVWVDGKVTITFAARFADRPIFEIGDGSGIGHLCHFTIGKRVSIGRNTTLSGDIIIMDSNAHATDPVARWEHKPPDPEDVRPVIIGDGVWIARRCIIFPGVRIGNGAIVSAGSVVRGHVPPYSVVAGNPAKVVLRLKKPEQFPDLK
jgi:acetyltransferase-like isoleucine patch superfamily enzyme